jgi:hypothetical protein
MQPSVIPLGLTPFWFIITIFILIGVMCVIYWVMKKWSSWQNEFAVWRKTRQHLEDEEHLGLEREYRHHQPSSSPFSRESYYRDSQYGYQSQVTDFVSKSSQHNFDAASLSTAKITTEKHFKSPSSIPPPKSSHSHRDLSSDYYDETNWSEDGLSSSSRDIDPGNTAEGGMAFEERNRCFGLVLSPTKRKLVEDIMKEFNRGDDGNR